MAITWTIIVLGALLHGMASGQTDPTAKPSMPTPQSNLPTDPVINHSTLNTDSSSTVPATTTKMTTVLATTSALAITTGSATLATTLASATATSSVTTPGGTIATPAGSIVTPAGSVTTPAGSVTTPAGSVTTSAGSVTTLKSPTQSGSTVQSTPQPTLQPGSAIQTTPLGSATSATSATKPVETTSATQPASVTPTASAAQPSASLSTIALPTPEPSNQSTTGKRTNTGSPTHLFSTEAPSSRSPQTLESQTTSVPSSSVPITSTPKTFKHPSFNLSSSSEGSIVLEACKKLGQKIKGNCSVEVTINGNQLIATVTIDADQAITSERYQPLEKKEEINKVAIPDTLIAILASCGALVLILCCFAAYCTYHRRSYRKNQQHLTEELQTVENGYHDNPTLEVMEVQPEMQEKKLTLNGEFNDSWIVPIDNLLKDDIPDEEDTHL